MNNDDAFGDGTFEDEGLDAEGFDDGLLEESLRQAAAVLDPVPAELRRTAVEAYSLYALDTELAELTFDSLVDALPVRGEERPRMLTFSTADLTVDVEVTPHGLMGQLLPPQPARIEVLGSPVAPAPTAFAADDMGRFACDLLLSGPFALRLRTGEEVVTTEWLRA